MTPRRGTLVLLRHAQSVWNVENRFSGWADVGLSERGLEEAHLAGEQLRRQGIVFNIAFVSRLARAKDTLNIVLAELGQTSLPIETSWQLNERHYGALQGLNKADTAARYGAEQFQRWRRGYRDTPPALAADDPRHPRHDPAYADVPAELLPATESLADTEQRVVPYWQQHIAPHLARGDNVLIVAHGNTLRALIKHLDNLSEAEVEKLEIPTGQPLIQDYGNNANPDISRTA